ncbi:MAG: multidrug effflux MFS transporter [Lautropia sp.]
MSRPDPDPSPDPDRASAHVPDVPAELDGRDGSAVAAVAGAGAGAARLPDRALLALLAATAALGSIALHMFTPVLPAARDAFGVPHPVAQLALSLPLLAMAPATLAYGPIADRLGRRPALLVSLVLFLAGTVTALLAPGIGWLVGGRVVQAVGAVGGIVLARTVASDRFPAERLAQTLATLTMVMVLAPLVAPLAGGLIGDLVGWRAIFVVQLAYAVLLAVVAGARLPETMPVRAAGGEASSVLADMRVIAAERRFRSYALQSAFATAAFMTFVAATPAVFVDMLGHGSAEFGKYFALVAGGYMIGNFIAVKSSARTGRHRMVVAGAACALAAASVALGLVLSGFRTEWTIVGPTVLMTLSIGVSHPNAQAAAIGVFPRKAGTAAGGVTFLQNVAAALAVQVVGLFPTTSMLPMAVAMVGFTLAALLSLTALRRPSAPRA